MSSHEFLTPTEQEYKECKYCGIRKSLICITCRYCYECHPVIEYFEEKPISVPYNISKLDDIEPK
jgi:hypothetical protein